MECSVQSRNHRHEQHQRTQPHQAVHVFLPTRKFTAPRPRNPLQLADDSPDYPSPPEFVNNFNDEEGKGKPGKINNLVLSDSSHSIDQPEENIKNAETVPSKKRPPHPFSNDNDLISDKVTPLILAGVRERLLELKQNKELPSESSSMGDSEAFSEDLISLGAADDLEGSTDSHEFEDRPAAAPRPSIVFQAAPGVFLSIPPKPAGLPRPKSADRSADDQPQLARRDSSSGGVFITGLSEKFMHPQAANKKAPSPLPQLTEGKVADASRSDGGTKQSGRDSGNIKNSKSPSMADINESRGPNVFLSMKSAPSGSLPRKSPTTSLPQSHSPGVTTFFSSRQSREDLAGDRRYSHSDLDSSYLRPTFNKTASQPSESMKGEELAAAYERSSSQSSISGPSMDKSGRVFMSMPRNVPPRTFTSLPRGVSMPSFTSAATPRMSTFISLGKRHNSMGDTNASSGISTLSRTSVPEDGISEMPVSAKKKASRWKSLDTLFTSKRRSSSPSQTSDQEQSQGASTISLNQTPAASTPEAAANPASRRRRSPSVFMAMPTVDDDVDARPKPPHRQHSAPEVDLDDTEQHRQQRLFPRRRGNSIGSGSPMVVMSLGWK